jgi:cytochrome c556
LEARLRRYSRKAQGVTRNWHPSLPFWPTCQVGQVLGHEVKRFIVAAIAGALVFSACGSSESSSGVNKDYAEFCAMAKDLETASSGPHGEDPAAITDPKVMKEVWTKVTALSQKMADNAPSDVEADVKKMISGIVEMNKIFSDNDYDLTGMATDVKVREALTKISNDAETIEASQRFQKFMTKNCGVNAN